MDCLPKIGGLYMFLLLNGWMLDDVVFFFLGGGCRIKI